MPKKPRSEQEVQKVREEILDKTLELINEVGYENFTMRKLANKLNMTATPIYQYYKNKDELYLAALTQGFETLYKVAEQARDKGNDPMERLRFVIRDVILFGLEHPGVYNILFISAVPKYYDYVGTENEDAATRELDAALRFRDFLVEVAEESGLLDDEGGEGVLMKLLSGFCTVHGYVALANSQITDYLLGPLVQTDSPELVDFLIDTVLENYQK